MYSIKLLFSLVNEKRKKYHRKKVILLIMKLNRCLKTSHVIFFLIYEAVFGRHIIKTKEHDNNFTCRSYCDGNFDLCKTIIKSVQETFICVKTATKCRATCDKTIEAVEKTIEAVKKTIKVVDSLQLLKTSKSEQNGKTKKDPIINKIDLTRKISVRLDRIWLNNNV
nr:uncharacterized protein LOC124808005 [Hydra vulgaris]